MGRTENSTERLQASRGHRHWAKEIRPSQTLFGVSGEVRSKNNLTESALLEMSGYGVISNDAGRFKRFYFLFFLPTNTPLPRHASCVSVTVLFFHPVTLTARPISSSSIRFCLPNISSVTIDHDELCDLPVGRRIA
jgi:hypothetical protein